jgi:hypothetical protein
MENKFHGNFTQQDGLPEIAIERATRVLRSGRLHRYNLVKMRLVKWAPLSLNLQNLLT